MDAHHHLEHVGIAQGAELGHPEIVVRPVTPVCTTARLQDAPHGEPVRLRQVLLGEHTPEALGRPAAMITGDFPTRTAAAERFRPVSGFGALAGIARAQIGV